MSIDLFQRITTLWGIPSLIFATATGAVGEPQPNQPAMEQVAAIERDLGGRIGVAAIDTGNGQRIRSQLEDTSRTLINTVSGDMD